ncbi:PHP domain-containing protein [bacterium]|nr:PHP domain-containing protein [bacterium]
MDIRAESLYEVVGAIHLHSDFSDGSLSIPEIAQIAESKNIDYLMFSDHNTLEPKRQGLEGWQGRVLVIIGCEINDPDDRNHYLAFRIHQEPEEGLNAKEYVRWINKVGGFGVIAHPAEKRSFSDAYPPYPWTDWDVEGFDGIEIWNQLSEWLEGVTWRNFPWRIWHPLRSIRFPVWETLERWDQLNRSRRVVGVGGIDVHDFHIKLFGFLPVEIYPYKVQFRSIRTHVLLDKPFRSEQKQMPFKEAERDLFKALSFGRSFISNASIGNAKDFRFWAENKNQIFFMGSRIPNQGELVFRIQSPLPGVIRLLRDGQEVERQKGRTLDYQSQRNGVYRVEIFRKRRGWVYSNPIVVGV